MSELVDVLIADIGSISDHIRNISVVMSILTLIQVIFDSQFLSIPIVFLACCVFYYSWKRDRLLKVAKSLFSVEYKDVLDKALEKNKLK